MDNTSFLNSGGRYNPNTDTWAATSIINAPDGRAAHTAVWTGSEMIVWGGESWQRRFKTPAGDIIPVRDSWTATSITNAPIGRAYHTAVWTGTEMVVWGGIILTVAIIIYKAEGDTIPALTAG